MVRVLGSGQVPGAGGAHLLSLSGSCSPPHRAHRALGPGVQHRGGALLGAGLHHPRGRDAGADLPGHGPSSATGEPPPPVPACPGACLSRCSVPGWSRARPGCGLGVGELQKKHQQLKKVTAFFSFINIWEYAKNPAN